MWFLNVPQENLRTWKLFVRWGLRFIVLIREGQHLSYLFSVILRSWDFDPARPGPVSRKARNCTGATIPFVSQERRGFKFFLLLPLKHVKRSAFQSKRLAVSQIAFRARKVIGTFEKRAPGFEPATSRMAARYWATRVRLVCQCTHAHYVVTVRRNF